MAAPIPTAIKFPPPIRTAAFLEDVAEEADEAAEEAEEAAEEVDEETAEDDDEAAEEDSDEAAEEDDSEAEEDSDDNSEIDEAAEDKIEENSSASEESEDEAEESVDEGWEEVAEATSAVSVILLALKADWISGSSLLEYHGNSVMTESIWLKSNSLKSVVKESSVYVVIWVYTSNTPEGSVKLASFKANEM